MQKQQDDRAWIIGASSGIGAELAKRLAEGGHKVAISARNKKALKKLHGSLKGEGHLVADIDVADSAKIKAAQERILDKWGHIDRMVFMAGTYTPMRLGKLDLEESEQITKINLLGAIYSVECVLPYMLERGKGQIAICASIAGYRGLPASQPYGATKAALINLAESLRCEHGKVIDVKVINPGFVKTPMTDKNKFDMPMIIDAAKAAGHIAQGLYTNKFEIHFPKAFTRMLKLLSLFPDQLYFWITRKLGP